MPVSRQTATPNPPPSSVSIGKKPMAYPPQQQQPAPQQPQQPPVQSQQQPTQQRSARAASKAPLSYAQQQQQQQRHSSPKNRSPTSAAAPGPAAGTGGTASASNAKGKQSANKIWSTNSTEERERIKDFWLGLGEEERKNLVKIEKDTVLKKMKEQQKHTCGCAVCGRKRSAIEEELEVLYEAYYDELEQYATYQQRYLSSGGALPPPPGPGPSPAASSSTKTAQSSSPPSLPSPNANLMSTS
ncbi:salt tolerance down-regulator-domain-containing protein [Cyathus striatus]|nr:salt tolerance down-regulator-domain-containing protein [Cyathus striatus]